MELRSLGWRVLVEWQCEIDRVPAANKEERLRTLFQNIVDTLDC